MSEQTCRKVRPSCHPKYRMKVSARPASVIFSIAFLIGFLLATPQGTAADNVSTGSANGVAVRSELKTVKLYGAGGVAGLDAFQSGFFVSADGHILTVWSTVLDVETVVAIGSDGGRYEARVVGIDPNLEIAILATGKPANNFFDLTQTALSAAGQRVIAISNLYGIATGSEMASVQKGVVMAVTELNARRGSFDSVYQGPVCIIDAMTNNPGAAGGALVNMNGQLMGMLGKELRDSNANTWLNYAIPISELTDSIGRIIAGESIARSDKNRNPADRPVDLAAFGIVLIPDILSKTPAFIDSVQPKSIAANAGLHSDDLILFVNSSRVSAQATLREELKYIDRADEVALLIQRGNELREIILSH